jgi:hypothetical protein
LLGIVFFALGAGIYAWGWSRPPPQIIYATGVNDELMRTIADAALNARLVAALNARLDSWDEASAKKSVALLKEWLSPAQLEQFERDGTFDVVGQATGKCYRITGGRTYNVHRIEAGDVVEKLCFMPAGAAQSPGDVMLAQKIALETDEVGARAVANIVPQLGLWNHRRENVTVRLSVD